MTPSQARIDAALRLADAVDAYEEAGPESWKEYVVEPLKVYRATLPKLRTRAEVDAEIAETCRSYYRADPPGIRDTANGLLRVLDRLCAEATAPEPALHDNGDPIPTMYKDCGKCRYPSAAVCCGDEWCIWQRCCGHEAEPTAPEDFDD